MLSNCWTAFKYAVVIGLLAAAYLVLNGDQTSQPIQSRGNVAIGVGEPTTVGGGLAKASGVAPTAHPETLSKGYPVALTDTVKSDCTEVLSVEGGDVAVEPGIACGQSTRLGALLRDGELLRSEGKLDQLKGAVGAMLVEFPDDGEACVALAHLFSETGDHEYALQIIEYCISRNPAKPQLRYALGDLLEIQEDATGAVAQYFLAVQLDPSDPQGYLRVGEVHLKAGNLALADIFFAHASDLNPDFASLARELKEVWQQ